MDVVHGRTVETEKYFRRICAYSSEDMQNVENAGVLI